MNLEKYGVLYYMLLEDYKRLSRLEKNMKNEDEANCSNTDGGSVETRRKLGILYDLIYRRDGMLNIFAQEEFQAIHNGMTRSIARNIEDNMKNYLKKDCVYTVKTITPYDCYAIVELKEFPGVIFEASGFVDYGVEKKSMDELLKEYGQDLDEDLKRAQDIIDEYASRPVPSDVEKLRKLYEDFKGYPNIIDALEEVYEYVDIKDGHSVFSIGDKFYDGYRNIEVINISDEPNALGNLVYFCRVVEDLNKATWYTDFDQVEMKIIQISDVKRDEMGLTEVEKLISKIVLTTGGIRWRFTTFVDTEEGFTSLAPEQKHKAGDCFEADGGDKITIIDVSPSVDCYNEWIYFYKVMSIADGNIIDCNYYAYPEDMIPLGVDN